MATLYVDQDGETFSLNADGKACYICQVTEAPSWLRKATAAQVKRHHKQHAKAWQTVQDYRPLVLNIARQLHEKEPEDFYLFAIQDRLLKAAHTHNPDLGGSLGAYMARAIRWSYLTYIEYRNPIVTQQIRDESALIARDDSADNVFRHVRVNEPAEGYSVRVPETPGVYSISGAAGALDDYSRQILYDRFINCQQLQEIARARGIHKSSACKHIEIAKRAAAELIRGSGNNGQGECRS